MRLILIVTLAAALTTLVAAVIWDGLPPAVTQQPPGGGRGEGPPGNRPRFACRGRIEKRDGPRGQIPRHGQERQWQRRRRGDAQAQADRKPRPEACRRLPRPRRADVRAAYFFISGHTER